jgi:hypothetical protein
LILNKPGNEKYSYEISRTFAASTLRAAVCCN